MPPNTFALCFTWKADGTSHFYKPHTISCCGLRYWKRYLGHSSVNKKMFQSSAVSRTNFLANLNSTFLCFLLNKGIFFRLKAFHPFLLMYLHTIMLETSIFFAWDSWQSSLIVLRFLNLFSTERNWSKQAVVRFLICLPSTLFSTTCSRNLPFC